MGDNTQEQIRYASEVKARHEADLMNRPGVIGVGVGLRQRDGITTDEVAIVVLVEEKRPPADVPAGELLPEMVEGVPVDVIEVGAIQAYGGA